MVSLTHHIPNSLLISELPPYSHLDQVQSHPLERSEAGRERQDDVCQSEVRKEVRSVATACLFVLVVDITSVLPYNLGHVTQLVTR
jgi:hypothetical protein